ncbi:MAG: type II secretion system F family protein [Pseudomonadota bacterium]
MKHFNYKAVSASGVVSRGCIASASAVELNRMLSSQGLTVLSYRQSLLRQRNVKWSRKELIGFVFHLEQMLAAGIDMLEALSEFEKSADNKRLMQTTRQLINHIDSGKSLSAACECDPQSFNPLVVNLIQAGEQSGRLVDVLGELGALLTWQEESMSRLKRAMVYPAFVAVVLLAVILFMMTWLVPGMISFIGAAGATLPWHTEALIMVSAAVSAYWRITAVLLLAGLVAARVASSVSTRFNMLCSQIALSIPLIGAVILKTRLARFSRCAAMMYSAGINVIDALRYARGTLGNSLLEAEVDHIIQRLIEGQSIAGSFENASRLPPLMARLLRVGESTGALDHAFGQLSSIYDRESKDLTEKLEQSLGPLMTVVVGLIMMWVVVSVIGPIYDLVFGMSGGQF